MQDIEGNIIGIDLGTTNSLVAVIEGTDPVIIPNAEGANKTPSVVAFMDEGEIVVGEIARRQAATNPARTITSIKRLMGRNFTDVQESNEKYPFVITDKDNQLFIDIDGMGYRPHQISALILQKLKESAEKFFKEPVSKAIITVPAYFDDLQRTDTKEAARLAGLEVLRLVNEPTAAAMAYGLGKRNEEIVTVYDFGGGTFDISILDIDNNAFEVIVSNGDTHLGGDDLDNALLFWIVEEFKKDYGVDLTEDPITLHRLREVAEKAKCELSTATQTLISLPFVGYRDKKPLHLEKMIRRGEFEDLIQPFVDRTIECCRTALEEAGIGRREISKAILVGGCSRIPMVQDVVEDFFGLSPYKGVNLDEIVALGAATQAGIFSGKLQEVVLLDITPHSLGVEVKDRKVSRIIEKNSTIPIKAAKTFTTTEDNQTFVNIHVVQGEKEDVMDNRSLGKFTLSDIEPSSAGIPRVRITFFIDADGVVEIGAQDLASGQEKNLTITHSFLTGEERQKRRRRKPRMVRDLRKKGKARDETGTGIISGVKLEPQTLPTLAPAETGGFSSTFRIVREDSSEASPIAKGPAPASTAPPAGKKEEPPTARKGSSVSLDKEPPGQEPPTPPRRKLPIDTQFEQEVRERLNQEETGEEALEVYDRFAGEISELIDQEITLPPEVFLILARIHTLKGSVQEALGAVANYREDIESDPEEALAVVSFIQQRFPDHTHVLMEKAELCHRTGKFKEALKTLEKLQKRDHSDRVVDRLEMLYHDILEKKPDPLVKFKLVKIYLKKNKLDEAIKILQDLTEIEEYRNRALKILGLTYWQKKIYALAWHNFKRLPPNPEIVDILYRIAMDIEKTGDLNVARDIYKRITDESPDYKDVSARFKKIDYRLQLQLKEAASQKPIEVLGDERFDILEEVNRGSMGVIYKARDKMVSDIVAIKILNDYLCQEPRAVERFKSEARAAKKLSHPYIVRIHDMFESGDKLFLSMEYIEGTDLKRMIASKIKFSEETILHYFLQMCDALGYAHSLGIIHRDIKPANIMITPFNTVKITDFGIAKILKTDSVTKSGTAVIGTPLYMAPEQITGKGVDARSDIYSMGVLLYEMVSGNPPFCEGNIEYHHVHTEPDQVDGDISDKLKQIIMKMIEKDPANRYQSVRDIFQILKKKN